MRGSHLENQLKLRPQVDFPDLTPLTERPARGGASSSWQRSGGYFRPALGARFGAFTASRRSLPALKRTFFDAGMLIFSLVRGLRPSRALRWLTAKLPRPGIAQRSPRWHESEM